MVPHNLLCHCWTTSGGNMAPIVYWALLATLATTVAIATKRPNIVLIVADDYGWNDIGYHGSEIRTPKLDALAASGVKLENYYVQPLCSPTRGQLMTGRYQIHMGIEHGNMAVTTRKGLPLKYPTVANMLSDLDYDCHMVGKWHLGFYKKDYLPTSRGFSSFYGYLTGYENYWSHVRCGNFGGTTGCGLDFHDNDEPVFDQDGVYSTHVFTEQAAKKMNDHVKHKSEQPMFLYLPFQSVHAGMTAPQEYIDMYPEIRDEYRRIYAGMVAVLDEAVGNVTDALKETGLWDNTLLIFTTDNGGNYDAGANNWPLRGRKHSWWEGGIHGISFVAGPFLPRSGATSHDLLHVSDWFPTLVGVAGGDTADMGLDGKDIWETISRGTPSPRTEILHTIDPLYDLKGEKLTDSPFDTRIQAALRVENWKIITGDPREADWRAVPDKAQLNSTLVNDSDGTSKNLWLFDIGTDPNEQHDLSESHPHVLEKMLQRLAEYMEGMSELEGSVPSDPEANPELRGGVWGPWVE